MTEKIDKAEVIAGRLIRVKNNGRRVLTNAKYWYYALWVEDADGGNERCWLLTPSDVISGEHRANQNIEDLINVGEDKGEAIRFEHTKEKIGRIKHVYNKFKKHWKACDYYLAIVLEDYRCLLFTKKETNSFQLRASRNIEDIPPKNFWVDLFD